MKVPSVLLAPQYPVRVLLVDVFCGFREQAEYC